MRYNQRVTATTTSCPRCAAGAAAGTARCRECGFVFFEEPARRRLPRPSPWWLAAALLALAAGVVIAVLVARDSAPAPLPAVAPARAEERLEGQLERDGIEQVGSVRCDSFIRPGRQTRCELVYADGDTQLMLVGLSAGGALDIAVPYPAQRRPGD